jgi:restriction system protein
MSIKRMVCRVLKESGLPMHINDIAAMITKTGLWTSSGQDPASSLNAILYADIKEHGDKSFFVNTAPGTFALRDSQEIENDTALGLKTAEEDPKSEASEPKSSYSKCVTMVLEQFGGGKPMHYKEIIKICQDKGWLDPKGKNQERTMRFQVRIEIMRQKSNGVQPCFVYYGRGYVGLSKFNWRPPVSSSGEVFLKPRWGKGGYSLTDCAEKVLLEFSQGQPMHYREIAK